MDKLQNNALIVKVECTKWSNTIEDRNLSVEIVSDKNAEARSLRVMKPLAKGPVIKELNKLIGQIGNRLSVDGAFRGTRANTLSWSIT